MKGQDRKLGQENLTEKSSITPNMPFNMSTSKKGAETKNSGTDGPPLTGQVPLSAVGSKTNIDAADGGKKNADINPRPDPIRRIEPLTAGVVGTAGSLTADEIDKSLITSAGIKSPFNPQNEPTGSASTQEPTTNNNQSPGNGTTGEPPTNTNSAQSNSNDPASNSAISMQPMHLPELEIVDTARANLIANGDDRKADMSEIDPPTKRLEIIDDLNTAATSPNVNTYSGSGGSLIQYLGIRNENDEVDPMTAGQWQLELFLQSKRQPYKVRHGDTIRKIAKHLFDDEELATLIFQINQDQIKIDRHGNPCLKPNSIIQLPSRLDIIQFKAQKQLQNNEVEIEHGSPSDSSDNRQLTYVCRYADTFLSIAKHHTHLKDARLWPLLAELNGAPQTAAQQENKLRRGQHVILPSKKQIVAFLAKRNGIDLSLSDARQLFTDRAKTEATSDSRSTTHIDPDGFHDQVEGPRRRIITQSDLGEISQRLDLSLELWHDGRWQTVIQYKIGTQESELRIFVARGGHQTIRISLPNRAARELAENDLAANAVAYCKQYVDNQFLF